MVENCENNIVPSFTLNLPKYEYGLVFLPVRKTPKKHCIRIACLGFEPGPPERIFYAVHVPKPKLDAYLHF